MSTLTSSPYQQQTAYSAPRYHGQPRKSKFPSRTYTTSYNSKFDDADGDFDDEDEESTDDAVNSPPDDPCYQPQSANRWSSLEWEQPRRVAQRCIPNFLNVAFGDTVKASSTCGLNRPENVCFDADEIDVTTSAQPQCVICDQSSWNCSHSATFLTDLNNPNNITFWASAPLKPEFDIADGRVEYENVTLHLPLGKRYEITYITLQFYANAMPESLVIYKSNDYGATWQPFQYYSSECTQLYGIDPLDSSQVARTFYDDADNSEPQQAFCSNHLTHLTDSASSSSNRAHNMRFSPMITKNHRIAFSTLDGRPPAYMYDDSEAMQQWTMATDIKIVLHRPLMSAVPDSSKNLQLEDLQPIMDNVESENNNIESSFNPTVVVTNSNSYNGNRYFRQRKRSPRSVASSQTIDDLDNFDETDEPLKEQLEKLEQEENQVRREFQQTANKLLQIRKALLTPTTNISAFFLQPASTSPPTTTSTSESATAFDKISMVDVALDGGEQQTAESISTEAEAIYVEIPTTSSTMSTTTAVRRTDTPPAFDEENDIFDTPVEREKADREDPYELLETTIAAVQPTKVFSFLPDETVSPIDNTTLPATTADFLSTTMPQSTTTTTTITTTTTQASTTTIAPPIYPVYAITDFAVGGRCHCNGHASSCERDPRTGQQRCVCRHNTEGIDCERCKKSFNARPWKRATTKNANECVECTCNNRARGCVFNEELWRFSGRRNGGVCLGCKYNTAGRFCQLCREGYYRDLNVSLQDPQACKPCYCHPIGSLGKTCNATSVQCTCKPGVTGVACNRCAKGYRATRQPIEPCVKILPSPTSWDEADRKYGAEYGNNYGSFNYDSTNHTRSNKHRHSYSNNVDVRYYEQYPTGSARPSYYSTADVQYYDKKNGFSHIRPPDKPTKKCGKCRLLARKASTKRFCKKHYAVQVLIHGHDRLEDQFSSWIRYNVDVQFVWKRRLHASPSLGPNHIWLPERAAKCGCPPLKIGQRYIIALGPPPEQQQLYPSSTSGNTKMIIDRTSLVIPWSQKMSARFSKFQRRAMLGKCTKIKNEDV